MIKITLSWQLQKGFILLKCSGIENKLFIIIIIILLLTRKCDFGSRIIITQGINRLTLYMVRWISLVLLTREDTIIVLGSYGIKISIQP